MRKGLNYRVPLLFRLFLHNSELRGGNSVFKRKSCQNTKRFCGHTTCNIPMIDSWQCMWYIYVSCIQHSHMYIYFNTHTQRFYLSLANMIYLYIYM